jgi:hypothetical protein
VNVYHKFTITSIVRERDILQGKINGYSATVEYSHKCVDSHSLECTYEIRKRIP